MAVYALNASRCGALLGGWGGVFGSNVTYRRSYWPGSCLSRPGRINVFTAAELVRFSTRNWIDVVCRAITSFAVLKKSEDVLDGVFRYQIPG